MGAAGRLHFVTLMLLLFTGVSGCNRFTNQPPPPFEVSIRVESDPGRPLPGAAIVRDGKDITATGTDGRAKLSLTGNEGDTRDFYVRCPQDFLSPAKPITIALRRLADRTRLPEYSSSCPPAVRKVVVAIRADGGPFLPVTFLGKSVARTDAWGAAHVLLQFKPGDQFELGLDTSEKGRERLRPQMPVRAFQVKAKDDIQLFDEKFTLEKLRVIYHTTAPRPIHL